MTDASKPVFKAVEDTRVESVVTVTGRVVKRSPETVNAQLPTGEIEVVVDDYVVQSAAEQVPLQVNAQDDAGEETRLRYRFLDLRRERIHKNILLRSKVIASIRRRMIDQGFTEFRRRSSPRRRLKVPATSWCRAGFIPASSMHCRRRRSSSSSS